jgi:mannose-1-phosphate guanylyltransferase
MLYAVILAGGSGTRFWPKSRKKKPKQLLNMIGTSSMLRQTVDRILPIVPYERILIVAGMNLEDAIRQNLPELPSDNLLLEPVGRNTAPAIGFAALVLRKRDPHAVMAVLPADHVIKKRDRLLNVLEKCEKTVKQNTYLITLGITPTRAETGYGYIEQGEPFADGIFRVQCFTEKPDRKTAEEFLRTGRFSWNSGMFLWKAADILSAMEHLCPELHQSLKEIDQALGTDEERIVIHKVYERIQSDSIDYAVMEKSRNVLVIPVELGWSDVGSWSALEEVHDKDENGNILQGNPLVLNTRNSILSSEKRLIAAVGVEDLIIVETEDALLVCHKEQAQEVKKIVELLKVRGLDQYL